MVGAHTEVGELIMGATTGENTSRQLKTLALERLMQYYRFLREFKDRLPRYTVTSAEVAEALHIHPTQVRKDFAAVGLVGMGRLGFYVEDICCAIRGLLRFDQKYEAVLVGTGHLGNLLLAYNGFARYGLYIVAAFNNGRHKNGRTFAGYTIQPLNALEAFIREHEIRLAILAPPTEASAELVDRLVSAGVQAIWNFTPTYLTGPSGILVRNEQHFSIGLSEILYHLNQ
jgi:redox-sensing transcriptional repressor